MAGWVLLKIAYLLMRWTFGLAVLMFRGDQAKNAELLVLRHENAVLRRNARRVRYEPADRAWFTALTRFIPRRRWTGVFPVTPTTLLAWHRRLAARRYDTSNRRQPGRPATVRSIARLAVRLAKREPALGIPADSWRAHQAGRDSRAVHCLRDPALFGYRSRTAPGRPDVAAVPARAGRRDPGRRFSSRRYRAAKQAVRADIHRARHSPDAPGRRHRPPDL